MTILFLGIKEWPIYSIKEKIPKGGGLGKYCEILVNHFPHDIKPIIITRYSPRQKKYEEIHNLKVIRLQSFGHRRLNIFIMNFFAFYKAISVIRKEKVDILHAHMLVAIFFAFLLGKIFDIPVVATPHGVAFNSSDISGTFGLPKWILKLSKIAEKSLFNKVDSLVLSSKAELDRLIQFTHKKYDNATIIQTGISSPSLERTYRLHPKKFRILFVGRLIKLKAVDNLILALKYLNNEIRSRIILDIVGDGPDSNFFKLLTKENKLDNYIKFHGFVESPIPLYKNADIFILPSYAEAFSIALLEAMSFGLACVVNANATSFNSEYIEIMKNNLPETIAASIEKLISNPQLIQTLGSKSKKLIASSYGDEQFAEKYVRLYASLL